MYLVVRKGEPTFCIDLTKSSLDLLNSTPTLWPYHYLLLIYFISSFASAVCHQLDSSTSFGNETSTLCDSVGVQPSVLEIFRIEGEYLAVRCGNNIPLL